MLIIKSTETFHLYHRNLRSKIRFKVHVTTAYFMPTVIQRSIDLIISNEPPRDKTNKMTCAPNEDSDQPGHPPSLIRVFVVRMKKPWVLSYHLSGCPGWSEFPMSVYTILLVFTWDGINWRPCWEVEFTGVIQWKFSSVFIWKQDDFGIRLKYLGDGILRDFIQRMFERDVSEHRASDTSSTSRQRDLLYDSKH